MTFNELVDRLIEINRRTNGRYHTLICNMMYRFLKNYDIPKFPG